MLLLDKTIPTQKIICTISEKQMTDGHIPVLKVENKESNRNYSLILPENTSNYKTRYDEFIFATTDISEWKGGKYLYIIWEYNPQTQTTVQELEIGLLQVIEQNEEEFISTPVTETDDDFVVYDA